MTCEKEVFCIECHKFYPITDLKIINGCAWCPGKCGEVHLIGNIECSIVARLERSGDRERRV